MDSDITTQTPFGFSYVCEKFCDEVYCGTISDEVVISNFFPVIIAGLFFIPVFVVFVKMLLKGKTREPVLLQRSISPNNIVILLLLSLVIAGVMIGVFWYL